jgi:DNA-binding NarL/FixJ family response regulator
MPIPPVTRILVADDHALVREGLKHVINAEPDLEVVAEAADGAEAVERSARPARARRRSGVSW